MTLRLWPRRLALLIGLAWLLAAHPQAQTAPVIQWTHAGTNVTHFQIVIGTTGTWVVDAGLPTPSGTTYEYALPALPAGTWQIKVRACYGADCQDSATKTVVKMVPAGSTALNYYWVSPTGTATWANCKSDAPPVSTNNAAHCSRTTASTSAQAGDTVWFRGGTYSVALYGQAIAPAASGSSGSPITFAAHPNETPVIEAPSVDTPDTYGGYITKDYIVVRGFTIHNMPLGIWVLGGSYNELSYNTIYRDSVHTVDAVMHPIGVFSTGTTSAHNWIHHNTIHTCGDAVYESCDGIKVGSDGDPLNHNSVQYNLVYHQGHTTLENYGQYEVITNNVVHNEGWKPSTAVFGTATSGSSSVLVDTSTNFTTAGVEVGHRVLTSGSVASNFIRAGKVTSITTTTNTNDTITFTEWNALGAPTFAAGTKYVVVTNANQYYAPDPPGYLPGNGKYAHRTAAMTFSGDVYTFKLFEGNRAGHAGANSRNNGPEALTLGAPGTVVRYNTLFGADGAGIYFKDYGTSIEAAAYNRVYSNTIYGNGRVQSGNPGADTHCAALVILDSTHSIGNAVKNNILFNNGTASCANPGDVYASTAARGAQTWGNNLCEATTANVGCTATSDPGFVSTTMTDPMSLTLPNLALQAGSGAINISTDGGRLTQANGAGNATTTLVVDDTDARYFQDGTWGSDLSRNKTVFPDWIAVGTVDNVAQISSINYATHTITLASALTWADNASVWLYKKSDGVLTLVGAAPDYGAHEYGIGTAIAPTGVVVR